MTGFLELETADLVGAARTMCRQVAEPVDRAVGGLSAALDGLGAMAGGDPAARQWAASYDRAAHTALQAGVDVTNACYRLATMFGRSARNYEVADSASAARTRHTVAADVERLPYDGELLMSAALPSAAGGSGGGPPGWGLVQAAVGYVWPDGHQDRLHAAAAAWAHSASVLDDHACTASLPALDFLRDRLPEGDDMVTVCQAMRGHLSELAAVHRSLGHTCTDLAHHIDTAHSAIISELEWMLGESAFLQGLGAAISAVTAGAAEAPTQGIEAGRIAKAVAAIKGFVRTFLAAVRALTARVGQIVDRAAAVASRVRTILHTKAATATARLSREYPGFGRAAEQVATLRLELGLRGRVLTDIGNPKKFDPESLRGMPLQRVKASIPKSWERRPSSAGKGEVFTDPNHRGRQIRVMFGYKRGSRSVSTAEMGPTRWFHRMAIRIRHIYPSLGTANCDSSRPGRLPDRRDRRDARGWPGRSVRVSQFLRGAFSDLTRDEERRIAR